MSGLRKEDITSGTNNGKGFEKEVVLRVVEPIYGDEIGPYFVTTGKTVGGETDTRVLDTSGMTVDLTGEMITLSENVRVKRIGLFKF